VKPIELIQKVFNPMNKYPEDQANSAKAAFLANLSELLKIDENGIRFPPSFCPDDHPMRSKLQLSWYAGMIVGYGQDIPPEKIRTAHMSMIFIWSRAIVSDMLGYEEITHVGVPAEYMAV